MKKKNFLALVWERGCKDNTEYYHKDSRAWAYNIGATILFAVVTPIVLYIFGQIPMPSQLGYAVLAGIIAGAIVFSVWYVGTFLCHLIQAPAKMYREEKRKADRFNWNDVDVSCQQILGGMGDKEFKGYRIKIENNKVERCYFFIELKYLEVDGKREDYHEEDKSRQLLWVSDDDNNRSFGVALKPRDQNTSKSVGVWELLEVIGNADNEKFGIAFCGYNKNDRIKPSKQYTLFSRFAKGELKLLGNFVDSSGLSSLNRKWFEQNIPGDYIYKFEIDVIDSNPTMAIFEKGVFEYHPDTEIQEAANEEQI